MTTVSKTVTPVSPTRAERAEACRVRTCDSSDPVTFLTPNPKLRKGSRHRRLKYFARCLVAAGCSVRDLLTTLRTHNDLHCQPPLDDRKIREIVVDAHCDAMAAHSIAGKVK